MSEADSPASKPMPNAKAQTLPLQSSVNRIVRDCCPHGQRVVLEVDGSRHYPSSGRERPRARHPHPHPHGTQRAHDRHHGRRPVILTV
jgi:hypothetical protein